MEVILALVALAPVALLVLWLLRQPDPAGEEELAALAAGNRPHVRDFLDREP